MTYNKVITEYKNKLTTESNKIKTEMDVFYNSIVSSNDIFTAYKEFVEIFDNKLYTFNTVNTVSFPKILVDSQYKLYCIIDSIEVSLDLRKYYNNLLNMILGKFPPLDDSVGILN